jgi:Nif-specific regulatory protein
VPSLIVREPGQVPYVLELREPVVAGRDPTNTLILSDKQVSRRHLRVEPANSGWRALDLQSLHGIRVNGQSQTEAALRDGDAIQLGGVVLIYRDGPTGPDSIIRTMTGVVEPPQRAGATELRRLRVLFDVGRVISALDDPSRAVERVLEMTLEVLACERGVVGLVDRNAGAGGRQIAASRGSASVDDLVVPAAALTAMLERRESVLLRDPSGGRSAMGAPLDVAGRVLGYLFVDDRARVDRFAPDDLDFLSALARLAAAALEQAELHQRATSTLESLAPTGVGPLLGDSEPMRRLRTQIAKCAAATDSAVLIHGETGTGKELVAAHIHHLSSRVGHAFVAVNCAAIPEQLIESELFGYQRGAFTGADKARRGRFAIAHRGTLFLDEIGDLALAAQAKLLRAIEEGEIQPLGAEQALRVDVRIVAATHKDLAAEVAAGRFREDLFYRLDVLDVEVPPLRVRGDDVVVLAEHMRDELARRLGRPRLELSAGAAAALRAYGWPGNVRQLRNEIERAMLLAEGKRIEPEDLRLRGATTAAPASASTLAERFTHADRTVWDLAQEALRRGGDLDAAAALLGITPALLERTLARDEDSTVLPGGDLLAQAPATAGDWTPIEDSERQLLERALRANGNNIRATARALGVARATL